MYSRKNVESRMELLGTPALTRYYCKDFPCKTTLSHLLLRKDDIMANTRPEIS